MAGNKVCASVPNRGGGGGLGMLLRLKSPFGNVDGGKLGNSVGASLVNVTNVSANAGGHSEICVNTWVWVNGVESIVLHDETD